MKIHLTNRMKLIGMLAMCLLPGLYLWLIAEDRYQSASHFSVVVEESNNAEASMGLLDLVEGSAGRASDTQIVIGFIGSTDLLFDLEKEFDLATHYAEPSMDFIFRMSRNASKKDRIKYYKKKIYAQEDALSGLIHLTVESFSPDLSQKVSEFIIRKTEAFINDLNKEIANKRLSFAEGELERAQNKIKENESALIAFQNKCKIIQPEAIIQAQLEAIQTLRLEKIHKEIELATLKASSPNAPTKKALESGISHLANEIKNQEEVLSGPDAQKLNQILAQYKELQLNLEFSLNLRKGAELILEKTRAETIASSRFFSVIQHPYLLDENTHPRRWYLFITSAFVVLMLIYITRAVIASVNDRV